MYLAVVAISVLAVSTGASAGGGLAVAGEFLPDERARPGQPRRDGPRLAKAGGKIQRSVGPPDPASPRAPDARSSSPGGSGSATDRTDSELMLEALKQSGVESPNAHRIDRVVDEIRAETKRKMSASPAVWKDPFAEDPERAIPVRSAGRMPAGGMPLKGRGAALFRREQARARAEVAVADAEAASARAAAAQAKASQARSAAAEARAAAVAARARAAAAKREVQIAEAAVIDPALARRLAMARAEQRARSRGQAMDAAFTQSARKPIRSASQPLPSIAPPPDSLEPLVPPAPYEALAKGHATGILVVPITR